MSVAKYKGAHFAVFPTGLVETCILAGLSRMRYCLDTFTGSGTTGKEAIRLKRSFYGIDLKMNTLTCGTKNFGRLNVVSIKTLLVVSNN